MKRFIIFGAGNYGKEALYYYGTRNVAFFADNDESKIGKYYCGKPIQSFGDLCDVKDYYSIVIALNDYKSVVRQFKENGISDYRIFNPGHANVVDRIISEHDLNSKRVALIGADGCASILIDNLQSQCECISITLSDIPGSPMIGENVNGYEVNEYSAIADDRDTIIVTSENRAYEIKAYLNRIQTRAFIINPFVQTRYYPEDKLLFVPQNSRTELSEEQYADSAEKNYHKSQINGYFVELSKKTPLFEHIEIETINRCNGRCDFCPVNVKNDIRERTVMDEILFKSIIDQLAELDYSGRLATFSNNEPFLDDRIIDFNRYAREKLKRARIHLFTNGSLLTLEKFSQIIPFLDELIIDNYNQKLELNDNPRKIIEYIEKHSEYRKKVTIVMRKEHEILTTRGGDAPNRKIMKCYDDIKCVLPYLQMIVRPDGKVSLCCNDPYGKTTLGDLSKQSITEVWYGDEFEKIRKQLSYGRAGLEHCRFCDTFNVF